MSHINTPSVVVCYYDPKNIEENQPKHIAQRCATEIVVLCEQLGTVNDLLTLTLEQEDIYEVVYLCQFHYENFLFRVYSLRERAWDVLAALVEVPRKQTSNKNFRNSVLSKIKSYHLEIYKAFSDLLSLIDSDIKNRNVATHETFLFLGLTFGEDFRNTYELDGFLTQYDPTSENGLNIQEMVRNTLQDFVTKQMKHIREINAKALDFVRYCSTAIDGKQW